MTAKVTYPVLDVALHPTGRMAFVAYKEKTVKLWDLTEGKSVFTQSNERQVEKIYWNTDGNHYIYQYDDGVELYSIDQEECINEIRLDGT